MTDQEAGALYREARDRRRWSAHELAAAVGISTAYVRMIEAGTRRPSRKVALAIQGALGDPRLPIPNRYGGGWPEWIIRAPAPATETPASPRPPAAAEPIRFPRGVPTPPGAFVDVEPEWAVGPVVRPDQFGAIPYEVARERQLREAEILRRARRQEAERFDLEQRYRRRDLGPVDSRSGRVLGRRG